ncbi:pyridoxal kinase [Roseibium alexandrii]|uniref:pyridoxal kinase n=1 Tax=Roseibium alexandrii (strain DSM 17067 / NCIMB 14079 / DFL-11) TaxID=244592 RepID=A0A5E8H4T4_ROSAD|nr:pyridoxal kinase [Roseibium alexandrii]EEE47127.1 pyridoxal kinase [Roseibium alexandrii DFL-11]
MTQPPAGFEPATKPILVITSQVVRGGISGRGLTFALERNGHDVWFLPTILLPWHPGHGKGTRIVPPTADFSAIASDLAGSAKVSEIGGIISGYLGSPDQAPAIADLIKTVKTANPDAPYLCDPVMGDHTSASGGGLYVPEATAEAIRDHLVPLADIVTPNSFELGWLTGREISSELEALSAARELGAERVLVTSAPALRRNAISNLLAGPRGAVAAEHAAIANPPHGTGDLMAGLLLINRLAGLDDEEAVKRASASVFELVARSVKKGADELLFADEQQSVVRAMALVTSRRVMEAKVRA